MSKVFAVGVAVILAVGPTVRAAAAQAQAGKLEDGPKVVRLVADPARLAIKIGMATPPPKITAFDKDGNTLNPVLRISPPYQSVRMRAEGLVGRTVGEYEIIVSVQLPPDDTRTPPSLKIPVSVTWPAITKVALSAPAGKKLYIGTVMALNVKATHSDGSHRPEPGIKWQSSNEAVATIDRFGFVTAKQTGKVTLTATVDGVSSDVAFTVEQNPAASIEAKVSQATVRTGDVVHLSALARGRNGQEIKDLAVSWSYTYTPDDSIAAPGATAAIEDEKFVAEVPGVYNVLATAGNLTARTTIDVRPRQVIREVEYKGRGQINHVHTSDLWPYQGNDGRDYMLVGTWGGDGWGYIYDITDVGNLVRKDSIKVDARTINDVTVSPTARYGAFSREGASNRVNGVVILDLANPAHPKVASTFDDQLTGGVHNMFAYADSKTGKEYLFAISGGDKYVIIDMTDIYKPRYVGEYNHPNSSVHDVWVKDGVAYSSEWGTGVVVVDVGNGKWGGTVEQPKLITTYPTKSGATHEVYPYVSAKTGKTYIFLGDEIMSRTGRAWAGMPDTSGLNAKGGTPLVAAGYTHIIDFTDPASPKNVARYENPEFGTHDIIVEDDILYQAYYDGGMRVVDVSGELLGNLHEQAREIAVVKPWDPNGYRANAPYTMNAMPYKGHVFFTDFQSGLWSFKIKPKERPVP